MILPDYPELPLDLQSRPINVDQCRVLEVFQTAIDVQMGSPALIGGNSATVWMRRSFNCERNLQP
jgi:hypothetical protein